MKPSNPDGFTLFELIVVLVIAGMMTVLVIPRLFNSVGHIELKSAARQTISLLHQARDMAYFQKKKIKVSLDLDAGQISVSEFADKKYVQVRNLAYSLPDGVRIRQFDKNDEQVTDGTAEIYFFPNSNSTGGTLRLWNLKQREYAVEVDFITGNARIAEQ